MHQSQRYKENLGLFECHLHEQVIQNAHIMHVAQAIYQFYMELHLFASCIFVCSIFMFLVCCFQVEAPARAGAIAPCDVKIPAQNTGLGPEKTSFFQALSIPTKIAKGTIEITVSHCLSQDLETWCLKLAV